MRAGPQGYRRIEVNRRKPNTPALSNTLNRRGGRRRETLRWLVQLVTVEPRFYAESREAEWSSDPATDPAVAKRDGDRAGRPGRVGESGHEEVKTQEGKVGHRCINRVSVMQIDSQVAQGPEGE